MGNIEHWREHLARNTVPECEAQAVCVNGRHCIDAGRCLRSGKVAVVPASQLEGAVEALEAVSAVIPAYWGKTGSNAQRRAYELLTAVLYPDATGGQ